MVPAQNLPKALAREKGTASIAFGPRFASALRGGGFGGARIVRRGKGVAEWRVGRGLPQDVDQPRGTVGGRCWRGLDQRAAPRTARPGCRRGKRATCFSWLRRAVSAYRDAPAIPPPWPSRRSKSRSSRTSAALACTKSNLKELPESAWKKLIRPPDFTRQGPRREQPAKVKRQIIRKREYLHLGLQSEEVAEFASRPTD
jgi:hypothetical protein